jgi:hypothetical protein
MHSPYRWRLFTGKILTPIGKILQVSTSEYQGYPGVVESLLSVLT